MQYQPKYKHSNGSAIILYLLTHESLLSLTISAQSSLDYLRLPKPSPSVPFCPEATRSFYASVTWKYGVHG